MSAYFDENGQTWRYRSRVQRPDGTMVRISGSAPKLSNTKAAAIGAEKLHAARVMTGVFEVVPPTPAGGKAASAVTTLAEYVPVYLENADHTESYLSSLKHRLAWIAERYGDLPLDQVGIEQYDAIKLALLDKGLKKGTINLYICALAGLLSFAKTRKVIRSYDSPALIPTRFLDTEKRDALSDEAVTQLLASSKDDPVLHCAHLLALDAGLRIGEIRALRREDIRGNMIQVEHSFWQNVLGTPKSGKSRKIPLTPRLKEALDAALKTHASPWVIVRKDGDHWNHMDATKWAPEGGWHQLRHTFCSRLANTPGVTPTQAMKLMGHSDLKTTLLYVHTTEAQLEGAIALLGQTLAKRVG